MFLATSFLPLHFDCQVFFRALFSIGISTLVLVILVLPKIKRVSSGEKVIVTNLLANTFRRGTDSTTLTHPAESQSTFNTGGRQFQDRIIVKKDDPLPPSIEAQVFEVQDLLGEIDSRCQEGRRVDSKLWKQMQRDVARFKMELDKVELDWDDEVADDKAEYDEAPAEES